MQAFLSTPSVAAQRAAAYTQPIVAFLNSSRHLFMPSVLFVMASALHSFCPGIWCSQIPQCDGNPGICLQGQPLHIGKLYASLPRGSHSDRPPHELDFGCGGSGSSSFFFFGGGSGCSALVDNKISTLRFRDLPASVSFVSIGSLSPLL